MWLYIPDNKPTSPSTPVEVDSISASDSRIQMLSRSYTWNESYRQPRSWLTTLKRDSWMQHLFGLIPEPSTANRLLTKWIGSLAASPASRSASPASSEEPRTNAGSGNTSGDWLLKYDPDTSSWKTPQVSLFTAELEPFSATFPRSGSMMLNGQVFERRMSVRPIAGNASSSWLTPHGLGEKGDHTGKLSGGGGGEFAYQANNWHTPDTMPDAPNKNSNTRSKPPGLGNQAQHWPTPTTQEVPHPEAELTATGRRKAKDGKDSHSLNLEDRANTWATPQSRDGKGRTAFDNQKDLPRDAANWATPVSDEIKTGTPNHQGRSLNKEVHTWLTPSANEDAAGTLAGNMQNMLSHQVQAQAQSGKISSPDVPTSPRRWASPQSRDYRSVTGNESAQREHATQNLNVQVDETGRRRLNPKFVEWLMGWPEGWLELHSFVSSATE